MSFRAFLGCIEFRSRR